MKLTKLMLAMIGGVALTFIAVGLTFAAPAARLVALNYATLDPTITPTVTIAPTVTITPTVTPVPTVTLTHTQPVAAAIALYFTVAYTQVLALHDAGLGYGEIVRVFMTARALSGTLTFEQVLVLWESGLGWGQIKQQYGVYPGGNGLGAIMSGRAEPVSGPMPGPNPTPSLSNGKSNGTPNCPGNSCNAPGQNKPGKAPKK